MPEAFSLVQLEPDEHVVFGIHLVTARTTPKQRRFYAAAPTSETRKGITNKRVVIESATGYTTSIANSEVKCVTLAREKHMGVDMLRIVSIRDGSGRTHPLDLGGINLGHESRLKEMFPVAKLATAKRTPFTRLGS